MAYREWILVACLGGGGCVAEEVGADAGTDDSSPPTLESSTTDEGETTTGGDTLTGDTEPAPGDESTGGVDSSTGGSGGMASEPDEHFPEPFECPDDHPMPEVPDPSGFDTVNCESHEECSSGINGRCVDVRYSLQCAYDECFDHDECGDGMGCACRTGLAQENLCRPAQCLTDADCPETGWCSPSYDDCPFIEGFFCHTLEDECLADSDCPDEPEDTKYANGTACRYAPDEGRWTCVDEYSCYD